MWFLSEVEAAGLPQMRPIAKTLSPNEDGGDDGEGEEKGWG